MKFDPEFNELYSIMQSRYNKISDFNELERETQVFFLAKFYLFSQIIRSELTKKVEIYQVEIANLENKIELLKKEKCQIKDTEYNRILIENEASKIKLQEILKSNAKLKEELSTLQQKYETIKQFKHQNKELNIRVQTLIKESDDLTSIKNKLESKLKISEDIFQSKAKEIEEMKQVIKELTDKNAILEKEHKQIHEEKNKYEKLYLRVCPNSPNINTEYESCLNAMSILNAFNTQENKKEENDENEIKIDGHITIYNKYNNVTPKKNNIPNIKNKYVKILEVNNGTNKQKNFDSNFNSILTVDDNNGIKEETISQKSEEEDGEDNTYIIDYNSEIDYENYNSLLYDN